MFFAGSEDDALYIEFIKELYKMVGSGWLGIDLGAEQLQIQETAEGTSRKRYLGPGQEAKLQDIVGTNPIHA